MIKPIHEIHKQAGKHHESAKDLHEHALMMHEHIKAIHGHMKSLHESASMIHENPEGVEAHVQKIKEVMGHVKDHMGHHEDHVEMTRKHADEMEGHKHDLSEHVEGKGEIDGQADMGRAERHNPINDPAGRSKPMDISEAAQRATKHPESFKEDKMRTTMHEFKHGELHSGSKEGPKVTDRKQAEAIGISEGKKKYKYKGI